MNRSVLSVIAGAALLGLSRKGSKSSALDDIMNSRMLTLNSSEDVARAMAFDQRERSTYTRIKINFDEGILDFIPDGFFKGFNRVHQLDMDVVGATIDEDDFDDLDYDFDEQAEELEAQKAENRRFYSGMHFRIPQNISDLTSLKWFFADNMNIEVPVSKSVEEITLGNCFSVKFPSDMSGFENLKKIYISKADFTSLPENIGVVQTLKEITINMAGLKSLPDSISNLRNLETLSVWGNHLTELPENIGNLSLLETLDIGHPMNERVLNMSGGFANFSVDEIMDNSNPLERLPDSIVNLKNLSSLGFTGLSIPMPNIHQMRLLSTIENGSVLHSLSKAYNMSTPSELRRF